jgi:hypothetical protein
LELITAYLNATVSPAGPYMIAGVPVWAGDRIDLWHKNKLIRSINKYEGYLVGAIDEEVIMLSDNEDGHPSMTFNIDRIHRCRNVSRIHDEDKIYEEAKAIYMVHGIPFGHGDEIEFDLPGDRHVKGYITGYDKNPGWIKVIDHEDGGLRQCNMEYMSNVKGLA